MTTPPPSEETRGRRLADGDEEAMDQIYHLYHERMLRFCGNFVVMQMHLVNGLLVFVLILPLIFIFQA